MDIDDKNDDSGRNLMHRTNDEIRIGENAKVTQHDIGFKDDDEGNNEYHIESTHPPILAVNITKNNAHICHNKNLLKGHKRSQPRSSFPPFDINCPKQQIIFNSCDQVDLQNLERGQKIYTYPCEININLMMLIGQLMWIVTLGREENQIHTRTTNVQKRNRLQVVITI